MSKEEVEIVKEFSQRFAEGDPNLGRDYFHPEIIWDTSASGLPSAGVEDSKVVRFRLFESREQAFEAAGLSE